MNSRYLKPWIEEDLQQKMVFLGGPRQVGKTTLAQSLLKNYTDGHPGYFNWDFAEHREGILKRAWPKEQRLIILDEIHKSNSWQTLVKGMYDTLKNSHCFLVTGSARLDHYRKGGDSLLGRYFYYRLHPFSLPEIGISESNLKNLFTYGGFPEPLFAQNSRTLKRWHLQRVGKLVRTDLRDLNNVKEVDKIEILAKSLPSKVGSPISYKSLAEDLLVDPKTVKTWIEMLSALYYCFLIPPFGSPKIRAVKKEQKLYLWDWSQIENKGTRFENLVASHLLKYCHFVEDVEGEEMELRYLRDTDKREVDFVVLKGGSPIFGVECKTKSKNLSSHISYFAERTNIQRWYQIHLGEEERQITSNISILPFATFCKELNLV